MLSNAFYFTFPPNPASFSCSIALTLALAEKPMRFKRSRSRLGSSRDICFVTLDVWTELGCYRVRRSATVGVYGSFLRSESIGVLHLIQNWLTKMCKSMARLSFKWASFYSNVPNECYNGHVVTHILVQLLTLGAIH